MGPQGFKLQPQSTRPTPRKSWVPSWTPPHCLLLVSLPREAPLGSSEPCWENGASSILSPGAGAELLPPSSWPQPPGFQPAAQGAGDAVAVPGARGWGSGCLHTLQGSDPGSSGEEKRGRETSARLGVPSLGNGTGLELKPTRAAPVTARWRVPEAAGAALPAPLHPRPHPVGPGAQR